MADVIDAMTDEELDRLLAEGKMKGLYGTFREGSVVLGQPMARQSAQKLGCGEAPSGQ